jgi:hypothetical protein
MKIRIVGIRTPIRGPVLVVGEWLVVLNPALKRTKPAPELRGGGR